MSIQEERQDLIPPPLPPPRHLADLGDNDIEWKWNNLNPAAQSMGPTPNSYESSGEGTNQDDRLETPASRIDEGYSSLSWRGIAPNESECQTGTSTEPGFGSSAPDRYQANAQAYDNSIIQKLDVRKDDTEGPEEHLATALELTTNSSSPSNTDLLASKYLRSQPLSAAAPEPAFVDKTLRRREESKRVSLIASHLHDSYGPINGLYNCRCCTEEPKNFETQVELDAHEWEIPYRCVYCNMGFRYRKDMARHQQSVHHYDRFWSCARLSDHMTVFDAFRNSSTRRNQADTCAYCGEGYPRTGPGISVAVASEQDWEVRRFHLQERHKFGTCDPARKFSRQDNFRRHLSHRHSVTKGKSMKMLMSACMSETPRPESLPQDFDTVLKLGDIKSESFNNPRQIIDNTDIKTSFSNDSGYSSMLSRAHRPDTQDSNGDHESAKWETESVASVQSLATIATISSVNPAAVGGAAEELAEMLINDQRICDLIRDGYKNFGSDRFERNLRRVLKRFALNLRKEASNELEKSAIRIVHKYRAYVVIVIRKQLELTNDGNAISLDELRKQKECKIALERFLELIPGVEEVDAEYEAGDNESGSDGDSDLSNDEQPSLPNLEKVKLYLLSSIAYSELKQQLTEFVRPGDNDEICLESREPKHGIIEEALLSSRPWAILSTSYLSRLSLPLRNWCSKVTRKSVAKDHSRIEWTCACGHDLFADFKTKSPKKLSEYAAILKCKPNGNSPKTTAQSATNYLTSPPDVHLANLSSSNIPKHTAYDSSNQAPICALQVPPLASNNNSFPSFLELCVNTGVHLKTLAEIDTAKISTDGALFKALREEYTRLRGFRSKFWLLKPAAVSFVRFSLENQHRVGILQRPLALPPKSEVDAKKWIYDPCPLDGDPPIAEDLFLHYLQCSEGSSTLFWMLRFPRKLETSLLKSTTSAAFGWGIHIIEGPDFAALFRANFVVVLLSGIAAGLWKCFKDDFQGAFGFACWIVAVLNSLLIAYIFKWRQE